MAESPQSTGVYNQVSLTLNKRTDAPSNVLLTFAFVRYKSVLYASLGVSSRIDFFGFVMWLISR